MLDVEIKRTVRSELQVVAVADSKPVDLVGNLKVVSRGWWKK